MRARTAGDLVQLSERAAVAYHFDAANYRILRWLLVIAVPFALVSGLLYLGLGQLVSRLAWLPSLGVGLWIFLTRSSPFFERRGRRLTMLYLALLPVATALSVTGPEPAYAFVGYLIPGLLLLFRFDPLEYLALAAVDAGVVAWILLRTGAPEGAGTRIGMGVGSLVATGLFLTIAMAVTRRRRESFLGQWRREVARERDSSRMRSELEDAREIQLSMLPVGAPRLGWVDFSSVSLPASEVGGDYFDYFELPGSRLAVVIADVAGHGMASGLVLSAVRSSLHLLRDELTRPLAVLRRIDQMLRDTVGGRLFVTLQIALLDPGAGRVTVANAGHPPLLLASPNGEVRRLGGSSLPLGTRLEGDFDEDSEPLDEGDALLLYSDGVLELRNFDAAEFGEERLFKQLRSAQPAAAASLVRDSLLDALEGFRGRAEQEDDLTLVVVKVGEGFPTGRRSGDDSA
jgi:hypothetical protein